MERYSDEAIRICNELHTERLDYNSSFVGVRAKESKRRRRAASVHGPLFYSKSRIC